MVTTSVLERGGRRDDSLAVDADQDLIVGVEMGPRAATRVEEDGEGTDALLRRREWLAPDTPEKRLGSSLQSALVRSIMTIEMVGILRVMVRLPRRPR